MKAITLQQPHATLVVLNAKRIETRSWNTQHRGTLLIHSGKAKPRANRDLAATDEFKQFLDTGAQLPFDPFDMLPFGYILGMVDIIDCIPTSRIADIMRKNEWQYPAVLHSGGHSWTITKQETAFGNYLGKRYAWLMANIVKFDKPIPCKGHLSLWDYEPLPGDHSGLVTSKTFSSHPLNLF